MAAKCCQLNVRDFNVLLQTTTTTTTTTTTVQSSPTAPTGSLQLDTNLIRLGLSPKVTWTINHPQAITDVITISETDTVTPKTDVDVTVSVIGVGISDGRGNWAPATTFLKFGSQWEHVYTGAGPDVIQTATVLDREVSSGTDIGFAARYEFRNYTSPFYQNGSGNVEVFVNGDTPPTFQAGHADQTSAAEFMRPYLDDAGRISLGPRDVIYAAELTHTDPTGFGFDLQDSVIIVNFTETE